MTPGRRGQLMLKARLAAASLPPLGVPPAHMNEAEIALWHEVVADVPVPLCHSDALALELLATTLRAHRLMGSTRSEIRQIYRALGDYFIPMPARRRLLFPPADSASIPDLSPGGPDE